MGDGLAEAFQEAFQSGVAMLESGDPLFELFQVVAEAGDFPAQAGFRLFDLVPQSGFQGGDVLPQSTVVGDHQSGQRKTGAQQDCANSEDANQLRAWIVLGSRQENTP